MTKIPIAGAPIPALFKAKGAPELRSRLKQWVTNEIKGKDIASRVGIESTWRTALRMYQGTPADRRWLPFENAPHMEVTIGAENSDAIYAQALDLIFQTSPVLTARSRKDEFDEHADAVQDLINWGTGGPWGLKPAGKVALLDDVQLGTGFFYVPFIKTVRKTDVYRIVDVGPEIRAVAPEHILLPFDCPSDMQKASRVTMRVPMSVEEANAVGRVQGWTLDDPSSTTGDDDRVMNDRRKLSGVSTDVPNENRPFFINYTWAQFDVDGDGEPESIYLIWNETTGEPLKLAYNQYDYYPFVKMVYQDRAHVPLGIGVMEMDAAYELLLTELSNNTLWNLMMRNMCMFKGPETAMPEVAELYTGKYFSTDAGDIEVMSMGEQDRTPIQFQMIIAAMAKSRVGVSDLNAVSRPANRTPGITQSIAAQQTSRRFTTPFDNMRESFAEVTMQCLYRIQEQLRGGKEKKAVRDVLDRVLGEEKADLIEELFTKSEVELTDALDIQLTAASTTINRDGDRQNMVMLSGLWEKYFQGMSTLAQIKAQPPFPGAEIEAEKASQVLNKFMHKILRTFDQIADVDQYLLSIDNIETGQAMPPELQAMMNGQAPQQNGASPQGQPPTQ